MLSDILKALELLTKGLKGIKSIDRKRRGIARQIVTIYFEIDEIVGMVNRVVSLIENGEYSSSILYEESYDVQRSLLELYRKFHDQDLARFLRIQFPAFAELRELIESDFTLVEIIFNTLVHRRSVDLSVKLPGIQELKEILDQITQLQEELRLLLVEKFKIEDIL